MCCKARSISRRRHSWRHDSRHRSRSQRREQALTKSLALVVRLPTLSGGGLGHLLPSGDDQIEFHRADGDDQLNAAADADASERVRANIASTDQVTVA
jgi:hypothetical protein